MAILAAVRTHPAAGTITCNTCAPVRGSAATFRIEFDEHRWLICGKCLPSCLRAAWEQSQFTPPFVTLVNKVVAVAA